MRTRTGWRARPSRPGALQYAINKPLVAMVLQGGKRVTMGERTYDFGAGESLLITTDVPTVSQITRASAGEPYISLVFDLDPAVIEGLVTDMGSPPSAAGEPVRIEPTEGEVADVCLPSSPFARSSGLPSGSPGPDGP
jgi:hypothetical protein